MLRNEGKGGRRGDWLCLSSGKRTAVSEKGSRIKKKTGGG